MMNNIFVVMEPDNHPYSILSELVSKFERQSVITVDKNVLKTLKTKPLFDSKYLLLFYSYKLLMDNISMIKFDFMLPVLVCSNKSSLQDAISVMKSSKISFKVYSNEFTREQAMRYIVSIAGDISDSLCNAIISQVGLNPIRIMSALDILSTTGFSEANLKKYVDKYIYNSSRDLIEVLLGVSKTKRQRRRAAVYLSSQRYWYDKYTKKMLLDEVGEYIKVFSDIINGKLRPDTTLSYSIDNSMQLSKVRYLYDLYNIVPLSKLIEIETLLKVGTILEIGVRI